MDDTVMSTSEETQTVDFITTVGFDINATSKSYESRTVERMLIPPLIVINLYFVATAVAFRVRHGTHTMRLLEYSLLAAIFFVLLQTLILVPEVFANTYTDEFCSAYRPLTAALGLMSRFFIYVFLWKRQSNLYTNPTVSVNRKRIAKFAGYFVLLTNFIIPVLKSYFMLVIPYSASERGCVEIGDSPFIGKAVIFVSFMLNQAVLFGLFIVPLMEHFCSTHIRNNSRVKHTAIRVSVWSLVCILTDVAFIAVASREQNISSWASVSFVPMILVYNSTLNIFTLVASFANWKIRLYPHRPNKVKPLKQSSNTKTRKSTEKHTKSTDLPAAMGSMKNSSDRAIK